MSRCGLIDRRGRRKGQKPLGGGILSQKEPQRGTFYTHKASYRNTHTHTHRPFPDGGAVASDFP